MRREPPFRWSTFLPLFGVGSALTVIYRQQPDLDPNFYIPRQVYVGLVWLGISLIVLAIVVSITSIASHGILLVWREALLRFFDPPRYQCRAARYNELERLQAYWERFFPGEVSNLAQDQAWHRKNAKLFWFLFEVGTRRGKRHRQPKLVGSFSIIPLTKKAADQVRREELVGANFTAEHIAKSFNGPAAVYLGGILADGIFAKAEILARVSERVEKLQERKVPILTRPVTEDGLRLVEKYDFQPVIADKTGLKHIYRLDRENADATG